MNCPPLRKKKKQLHLLCRAVHPRSRRQQRRRSQVRIQTTKIRPGHLSRMNLQLHPNSTRTIQSTCRCNPTVRKNSCLTFQLHPALEVHRELCSTLTEKKMNQKTLRRRGSTMNIEGNPVLLGQVKGTFKPSNRCGFSRQKYTDRDHVDRLCKNMTDDDRALFVLHSSKQESLKASSTSALIGKKRKEATATETKAYQKQFLEAKHLECRSWLDNEVFDFSRYAKDSGQELGHRSLGSHP